MVFLVHHFQRKVSFLEGLIRLHSCSTQDVDPSIKFCRTLPDCCKRSDAIFSLQHRLDLPSQREVRCLVFSLDALKPCVLSLDHRANLATDVLQSVVRVQLCNPSPLVPVSDCPPFPSFSPNSTLTRRPHQAPRLVRSFVLGWIDRPEQSAVPNLQMPKFAAFVSC